METSGLAILSLVVISRGSFGRENVKGRCSLSSERSSDPQYQSQRHSCCLSSSSLLFSLLSLSNYICSFYKSFYPSTNWHLALWRALRFFSATGKSYFPSSYSFTINPYTSQISPWKIKKKPISWNLCWLEDNRKRRSWRTSCCRWIGSRPMHHLAWSRLDCLVLRLFLGIWAGSQLEAKKKYKFPS